MLEPPPTRVAYPDLPLLGPGGNWVFGPNGAPLRSRRNLPNAFPHNPEGWEIEMHIRLDPMVSYRDLLDRVPAATPGWATRGRGAHVGQTFPPRPNTLNMRRIRERRRHNGRDWGRTVQRSDQALIDLVRSYLSWEQVRLNTTWTVVRGPNGAVRGIHPPWMPALVFPPDTFLPPGVQQHVPSPRLQAAIDAVEVSGHRTCIQ